MNSNIIIVALVSFILANTPLRIQAAALECAQATDKQCNLKRELHQESPRQRDTSHVKHIRQALPRPQGRTQTMPSQEGDLLQELLTGDEMWHASIHRDEVAVPSRTKSDTSKQLESVILNELLVEN